MKSYFKSITILLFPVVLFWCALGASKYIAYWAVSDPITSLVSEAKSRSGTENEKAAWLESKMGSVEQLAIQQERQDKLPYLLSLVAGLFLLIVGLQAKWLKSKLST